MPATASGRSREQPRHRVRRLQIPLGVQRQPPPGVRERRLVADAGEDVEQRPIGRLGEADAVGGDDRHVERRRQIDERMVVGLFVAQEVALQLDADVRRAPNMPTRRSSRPPTPKRRPLERRAAGERDEPADVAVEIVERERAFAFRRAQLHPRDQPAEVAIAVARFDQEQRTGGSIGVAGRSPSARPSARRR